jgi:hypothetical protein
MGVRGFGGIYRGVFGGGGEGGKGVVMVVSVRLWWSGSWGEGEWEIGRKRAVDERCVEM